MLPDHQPSPLAIWKGRVDRLPDAQIPQFVASMKENYDAMCATGDVESATLFATVRDYASRRHSLL